MFSSKETNQYTNTTGTGDSCTKTGITTDFSIDENDYDFQDVAEQMDVPNVAEFEDRLQTRDENEFSIGSCNECCLSCANVGINSVGDALTSINQAEDDENDEYDECGLAQLYLNEVQIDREEEEQAITDLVEASEGKLLDEGQANKMRVAFGIILRLVLPLANGVARGIRGIADVRFIRVLRNIVSSREAFTNLVAFAANTISMNLSAVQVSHRIEPILKLMKIRKSRDGIESLPDVPSMGDSTSTTPCTPPSTPTIPTTYSPFVREPKGSSLPRFPSTANSKRKTSVQEQAAPKCCTLNVLAEPPPGTPIRADIVFIHGLHGSLVNTWKQGLWENERRPVEFQRPPKPPVRPPKRPRHSRSTLLRPPHKQKRARFAQLDLYKQSSERETNDELEECSGAKGGDELYSSFSYTCGQPEDIQVCDGIEYSFPTFRLRINDNGRQLQAELDSMLNDDSENSDRSNNQSPSKDQKPKSGKATPKPSSDDPDYSKCWPGDWLPLDCPGVRVIAVNYTTDQYLWRPLWKKKEPRTNLIQRSREMAELLIAQRVGYGHPIVWVGHSKGGLFVKQIIVDAWESGRPAMAPFWRSARGAFFYSVPHRGSHLASIKAPLLTRSVELIDIEKNSKYLLDLHRRFAGLYHLGHLKIEVFSFVETALTLMSVLYMRIVGVDSADPGIGDVCGIRLDHREICKPRSRECILYKELVKMIKKVC